jgi:hypothetical protein
MTKLYSESGLFAMKTVSSFSVLHSNYSISAVPNRIFQIRKQDLITGKFKPNCIT